MAALDEMPPPRAPRGDPGMAQAGQARDSGGSMNQGNQNNQNKGGINWGYVVIVGLVLWVLSTQANLGANTWAVAQNTGATQATGDLVGGLTSAMKGFSVTLTGVQNSMATLSQNQAYLNQRMGKLETTVNQQGQMLGNINGNVLSLQQGQQQTNALLLSLGNGSEPQNANLMGQMFQGQVGTQLGGMPLNGVAGVFPGAQPQGVPQTTIDANGEMHVVDPFGRINSEPDVTFVTPRQP